MKKIDFYRTLIDYIENDYPVASFENLYISAYARNPTPQEKADYVNACEEENEETSYESSYDSY